MISEAAYFGSPKSKNSINSMFQRLCLIGIFDKRIEIIVDSNTCKEILYEVVKVGISRTKEIDLFLISIGIENQKNAFEELVRFDNSDNRDCNLMFL